MASSSTQTPRRIPGAPPNVFLEGAGFSYNTDPVPPLPPQPTTDTQDYPWGDWSASATKKKKKKASTFIWDFDVKGKGKEKENEVDEVSITSPYGEEEVPVFGKPFGFRTKKLEEASPTTEQSSMTKKRAPRRTTLNPYEDLLADADDELDLYAEGKGKLKLTSFGASSGYSLLLALFVSYAN